MLNSDRGLTEVAGISGMIGLALPLALILPIYGSLDEHDSPMAKLLVGYVFGLPSAMTCLAGAALVAVDELAATTLFGTVATTVVPFGVLLPVWLYVPMGEVASAGLLGAISAPLLIVVLLATVAYIYARLEDEERVAAACACAASWALPLLVVLPVYVRAGALWLRQQPPLPAPHGLGPCPRGDGGRVPVACSLRAAPTDADTLVPVPANLQVLVDCTEPEKELLFVYAFLFPAVTGFAGIGWHFVYDEPRLAAWASAHAVQCQLNGCFS